MREGLEWPERDTTSIVALLSDVMVKVAVVFGEPRVCRLYLELVTYSLCM